VSTERVLLVSSPTCEPDKTQASIVYLATTLNKLGVEFEVLDLCGALDYFDPPAEFLSPWKSESWLSTRIFADAQWLDRFLPNRYTGYNAVFYSALFSPDILIHGRHSFNQKLCFPNCQTIIGGSALSTLNDRQLSVVSQAFDFVCTGYDVGEMVNRVLAQERSESRLHRPKHISTNGHVSIQPDFQLVDVKRFITSYSGHGCNWGKCRFCNSALNCGHFFRPISETLEEFDQLSCFNGKLQDVMLSSDSFSEDHLKRLATCLVSRKSDVPYNIMLRGENWVTEELGDLLRRSGCTDVFIGAEALSDGPLQTLNKGLDSSSILTAVKNLSPCVNVILGLILFVPGTTESQLDEQLKNIEATLPHVTAFEPEILSVIQGTEFARCPEDYGIRLWPNDKSINDSWCHGLSPDIPWIFENEKEIETWFRHCDDLKGILSDLVEPQYWDSIDAVRMRFESS